MNFPKKIIIERIPTAEHRYPTAGDYYWSEEGVLVVKISEELQPEPTILLLMHELHEMFMCMADGISFEAIDAFDNKFEAEPDHDLDAEPGDDLRAPYHRQHTRAEVLERILADFLHIDWQEYGLQFHGVCRILDQLKDVGHWNKEKPCPVCHSIPCVKEAGCP